MTENVLKYKVTFGQSTAPFIAARFPQNDLLPIVPFDAPLAKGTTVAPETVSYTHLTLPTIYSV